MSKTDFKGDVYIYSTNDGGEIGVENGLILDCNTFSTAVYISLFGGNVNDTTGRAKETWWGNFVFGTGENEKLISQFQAVIKGLPLTSGNLKRAQEAAKRDLGWLKDEGIADSVNVTLKAEDIKKVCMTVEITKDSASLFKSNYYFEWEGAKNGLY